MNSLIYKPNLGKRSIATLFDYGLFLALFVLYIQYFGWDDDKGRRIVSGFMGLPIPLAWVIYFVVVEARLGATIGHRIMGLKVVTTDRENIKWPQALKRHLLDVIDIFFYGIPAIIAIKKSEKHQRLGDMWAGTIVIDTEDATQYNTGKPGPL